MNDKTPPRVTQAGDSIADDWRQAMAETYVSVTFAIEDLEQVEKFAVAPSYRLSDGRVIDGWRLGLGDGEKGEAA